jgi:hypothetical protein
MEAELIKSVMRIATLVCLALGILVRASAATANAATAPNATAPVVQKAPISCNPLHSQEKGGSSAENAGGSGFVRCAILTYPLHSSVSTAPSASAQWSSAKPSAVSAISCDVESLKPVEVKSQGKYYVETNAYIEAYSGRRY